MTRSVSVFASFLVLNLSLVSAGNRVQKSDKDAITYLETLAVSSGGFRPSQAAGAPPTLRATTAAARALKYLGGALTNAESCRKFVHRCFDASTGGFSDTPGGKADVLSTAIGLMVVVDLKMPVDRYAPAAKYLADKVESFEDIRIAAAAFESLGTPSPRKAEWIKEIRKMQNADGTFGSRAGQARATGGAVAAILRLGGTVENRDRVLEVLRQGQRQTGAFGKDDAGDASDLETTYRVMRTFKMLKSRPADVPALETFIAKCRNADGGYGVAPGQPSSAGGTYYAAIIRHWLE